MLLWCGWSEVSNRLRRHQGHFAGRAGEGLSRKNLRKEAIRPTGMVPNDASVTTGLGKGCLEYRILSVTQIAPRQTFSPCKSLQS